MDNSGLILSVEDAKETSRCLLVHLQAYSWLASFFWEERRLLFRLRPKHHCVFHQSRQFEQWRINQAMFHCFDQESFLGKLKNILPEDTWEDGLCANF